MTTNPQNNFSLYETSAVIPKDLGNNEENTVFVISQHGNREILALEIHGARNFESLFLRNANFKNTQL